ncbi:hypothetical protein SEA_AEGEUS_146 [Mycobacterium phage Aegeus]|nr:hypothetical protein SEA_BAUDELAIRE_146 [Mycobacterium phage Baudelaire]WKW86620.1 hypothetical protein SEA_AEGEUS_146 [Mycobacterium phage Aegeus]
MNPVTESNRVALLGYPTGAEETIIVEGVNIRQACQITSFLQIAFPHHSSCIESVNAPDDYPFGERWKAGRW